jgi:hypothetical protein
VLFDLASGWKEKKKRMEERRRRLKTLDPSDNIRGLLHMSLF